MKLPTTLKQRIANQELTIGSWLGCSHPTVCELMASAGFDWLVIDTEHSPIDIWQVQQMIQIIDLAGCVPLVRVGANDPRLIKQAMDAGAHGVVVPMVNTAAEARQAVAAMYYPPFGSRGVGLARAHAYGLSFEEYKAWLPSGGVLIVQIEHIQAVENLDAILAVEGVDGFLVGPYDLSGSVGQPGNFEDAAVATALDRIQQAIARTSKVGGFHIVQTSRQRLLDTIQAGYKFIAYGYDMLFFAERIQQEVSIARQVLT